MSKLSRNELEAIIKRDRPGTRIVGHAPDADDKPMTRPAPDSVSPASDAVRRKYSNPSIADDVHRDDGDDVPDDAIVSIAPEEQADPWDRGSRAKSVVVSGRERRVVGEQG